MSLRHALRGALSFFFFFLLCAAPAFAQFILPPSAEPVLLRLDPSNPEPGSLVRVSASSLTFDLTKTHVTWYANEILLAEGDNLTSADVALDTESATHIVVLAEQDDQIIGSAEVYIRPAEVDLIWESDSYAPPFYKGRRLASPNSTINIESHARLRDREGNLLAPGDIIYTWRRNDALLLANSGRGKFRASLPAPLLFGSDEISLDATSLDESVSAEATINIPSTDPFVDLYQEHPLFGILYHAALEGSSLLPDVEATLVAVVYFATDILTPDNGQLSFAWRVNNREIAPSKAEPNRLTINAENSTGEARVEVAVSHRTNYFLDARGVWDIAFNRIPGGDPF